MRTLLFASVIAVESLGCSKASKSQGDEVDHSIVWSALAKALIVHRTEDDVVAVCKRRGIEYARTQSKAKLPRPQDALRAASDEMDIDQLRGLVVELAATHFVGSYSPTFSPTFSPAYTTELLRTFGVDMKSCRAAAKSAAKAPKGAKAAAPIATHAKKKPAPAKPASKATAKKKPAKKPAKKRGGR